MYKNLIHFSEKFSHPSKKEALMLIRERMSHPVITINADSSMKEALDLMRREHIRRLPVINKRGQMVGIVTETDLAKASPSEATTLSVFEIRELTNRVKVEEIMTSEVVTIAEDTPIEEAARIMADCDVSGLPVMREGKLVGLITETDLFKIFLELFGARESGVRLTIEVPKTPGQLAKLTRAIFELGGDILALGTFMGETSETGQITVKVDGVPMPALIDAVRPLVLRISDVRESDKK
jgi:acetoin utilization protein AcuB